MDSKAQRSLWKSRSVQGPETSFNRARLTLARKWNGLTKTELANRAGVTLRSVTAHEAGESMPDEETLCRFKSALGFGRDFFFGSDLEEPTPDETSFRALSKMTAGRRDMALARGALAFHVASYLDSKFELPVPDLPDLSRERTPESASDSLRRYWGIGELPVRNVIHLLEAKGVRVFSIAIDSREVDAFSMWKGGTPLILLNTTKSSERSRYDAAHELGHLVLHCHGAPNGQKAEQEADAFASAFLMPRSSVLAHAPRFSTLDVLLKLKKIWGTSLAALVYRLHSVGVLRAYHYRALYIQLAQLGYLTKEPESGPRETSQVLPKLFASLYDDGLSRSHVARELSIPLPKLEELMFGLLMTGIDGGKADQKGPTRVGSKLKLVKE